MNNTSYILKDFLEGENKLYEKYLSNINLIELKEAFNLLVKNPNNSDLKVNDFINNLWKITYTKKPPTIEEFLTHAWIGDTSKSLFSHVRETIINFFDPSKPYRSLYLSSCIGFGKSTLSAIIILYILVNCYLMRDYKKYFNISASSSIVSVLGSFSIAKSKQVLLKPFMNILQSSPKFRRIKYEEKLPQALNDEEKSGQDRIVWTTASTMSSALQLGKDIHIMIVSDPEALLGLNIITGALSELSFFIKKGISYEQISQMASDLESRIFNRFSNFYLARALIDSSPFSFETPLDKYVFSGEAEKDKKNMVVMAKHWELKDFHWKYPEWQKTGKVFYAFRGSAGNPTKEIFKEEIKAYHKEEVFEIPIDLYNMYNKNPEKIIKDFGGFPSSGQDRLITDYSIIDKLFQTKIQNIEYGIKAPANQSPKRLIWDQIYKKFFIEVNNNFKFYRNPLEKRFIHVDQSEVTDMAFIVMGHPELNKKGESMVIVDFTIGIIPDKRRINFDAIVDFIIDLKLLGKVNIELVTFDQFQSSPGRQRLEREEINVERFSVDSNPGCYYSLISLLQNELIKCGKNIILKNNLKSIQETFTEKGKKRVDHIKGKLVKTYDGDWENSLCGVCADDCSESVAAVVNHCLNKYVGTPRYIYNEEFVLNENENIYEFIKNKYNLVPKYK